MLAVSPDSLILVAPLSLARQPRPLALPFHAPGEVRWSPGEVVGGSEAGGSLVVASGRGGRRLISIGLRGVNEASAGRWFKERSKGFRSSLGSRG